MCGRFTLHTPPEILREHFDLDATPQFSFENYNITPSQDIVAVRESDGRRELVPLRWGLIPSWSRDARTGNRSAPKPWGSNSPIVPRSADGAA
jgi:putative SOS response-associated peptidase YedK